jgi:hypothetical protein
MIRRKFLALLEEGLKVLRNQHLSGRKKAAAGDKKAQT